MQDQAKLLNEVNIVNDIGNKSCLNCDDHFFIFEVNIVKSINALCIIVRDSEIPYNTEDEKNETQHLQFTMEGTVPSSVLLMYKLACEQTLLLREVTRERHARSLMAWLASLATQCVGIAWHHHQRDGWNKTEHYYTHCAHLTPKRNPVYRLLSQKGVYPAVISRIMAACLSFVNAQLKHFFPCFFVFFFSAGSQLHSKRSCHWSQLRKSRSANECSAWKVRDQGTVIEIKKREAKLVSW